ncbi:MAG: hypothetical protein ACREGL_10495, partial [Alphaproteobacteria bacterium]
MTPQDRTIHVLFPLLLLVIVQALFMVLDASPVLRGEVFDTDGYMRLNRVLRLHETGDWFDTTIPRGNAPYGEVLIWTRPLDVLLIAGAWLLSPIAPFEPALFWSGAAISPLLQLATVLALGWAVRPIFDWARIGLLGLLFAAQPDILSYYLAGRADHHGLILLLFVLSLGFTLRFLLRPHDRRLCLLSGAAAGLSIWVSVEGLVALCATLATLAAFWVASDRDIARKARDHAAGMLLVLTAAVALEQPDVLRVEYDRVSVVHWTIGALLVPFWWLAAALEARGPAARFLRHRLAYALAGAGVSAAVLVLLYPMFFRGPLADMDPRLFAIWFDKISEIKPLLASDNPSLGKIVFVLGIALAALPFLAWTIARERGGVAWPAWVMICVAAAVYLPLALAMRRWSAYVEIILLVPYVELLARVLDRLDRMFGAGSRATLARSAVMAVFAIGFLFLGGAMLIVEKQSTSRLAGKACPLTELSRYLDDPAGWGARRRTILTFIDFGPELMYRTRHGVVATPQVRNEAGILDAHGMLTATDDGAAQALVAQRRVDLVLLCPRSTEEIFYGKGGNGTLYGRLLAGQGPRWL